MHRNVLLLLFAGIPLRAAQTDDDAVLAGKVLEIFRASCAGCHMPEAEEIGGKFDHVLDLKRLAANKDFIVPGRPEESEIFLIIDENEMPPKTSRLPPLASEEKEIIRRWIERGAKTPEPPEPIQPAAGAAKPEPYIPFTDRLTAWIGNFHMPAVHFPIALLICALLAEVLFVVTGRESFTVVVRFCLWVGFLSALPAVAFGWARAAHGVYAGETKLWTLYWHRWLGVGTMGWALVAALASELRLRRPGPRTAWALGAVLLIAAALAGATGAFGGALVYGWNNYAW